MEYIKHYFVNSDKRRYYKMHLGMDLFGDWVLTKAWGSIDTHQGRMVHLHMKSLSAGEKLIETLSKLRLKHGYTEACVSHASV